MLNAFVESKLKRPLFNCKNNDQIKFVATRQIRYNQDGDESEPLEVVFYEGFNSDAPEKRITRELNDNLIIDSKCAFFQSTVRKSQLPPNHVKVNFNSSSTQSSSSWTILPSQRT